MNANQNTKCPDGLTGFTRLTGFRGGLTLWLGGSVVWFEGSRFLPQRHGGTETRIFTADFADGADKTGNPWNPCNPCNPWSTVYVFLLCGNASQEKTAN